MKNKLIEKSNQRDERIKKQKEENYKELNKKYLANAMSREDAADNLLRHERKKELERKKKLELIEERNEKLEKKRQLKKQVNLKQRQLSNNLDKRKNELLNQLNYILSTGKYQTREEIYAQVFDEDELKALGQTSSNVKTEKNEKKYERADLISGSDNGEDDFFLTQGGVNDIKSEENVDDSEN